MNNSLIRLKQELKPNYNNCQIKEFSFQIYKLMKIKSKIIIFIIVYLSTTKYNYEYHKIGKLL